MKKCLLLLAILAIVFFAGAVLTHAAWSGPRAQAGESASLNAADRLSQEDQIKMRLRNDRPTHWRAFVMQR